MFKFFSLNYLCYALIFLLQIITIRLFGDKVFGFYAVYLSFMALIEAPLISARSEAAIKILNVSTNKLISIKLAMRKDFLNSIFLMPIIFSIFYVNFDFFIGILAWATIAAQSGYAHLKSYLIVTNKKIQSSFFEFALSLINIFIALIAFFFFGFNNLTHLIILYLISAILKNCILFLLIYCTEPKGHSVSFRSDQNYSPFSLTLIIRSLSINALSNLDIIILSTQVNIEIIALYKILKSLSGLSFRIIAPIWRWSLYSSNRYVSIGAFKAYHKSHLKSAKIAIAFLTLFIVLFITSITHLIYILYNIPVDFENWFVITAINAFITSWFISWFKIDMLFRADTSQTVVVPLLIAIMNSFILYFVEDFALKIYFSGSLQALCMMSIFMLLNTTNFISQKYPLQTQGNNK